MNANEDKTTTEPEEGLVHITKDYNLFNYIESNRNVSKSHVQQLVNSFEANPDLVRTRPILVNENMEVIDGQHRLQACMTLRIPVYYMIAKGTDVESAQLMNALQRGWSIIDFARSYALQQGDAERAKTYKEFLQLFEEYRIPATLLIQLCEQRSRHGQGARFKQGLLNIKDIEKTRQWLDMLDEIRGAAPGEVSSRYAFLQAVASIIRSEAYDHARMLAKIKSTRVQPQIDKTAYMRELERVFNLHMGDRAEHTRFF